MKNIFRFLCAAMLLVSFAACDDENNGNNNTPDGDDNTLAAQLVGTWQSEHILVNGEEAHMQMTITLNDNGTGKIEGMEEAFNWQVNGNDVTITLAQGNTYLYTVTNITEEILVITGTTVPGSDQEASFEGHFKKVTGDTPGTPDPGDLGIGTPELEDGTPTSLTVKAHVTGSVSQYLGQFPNYTCGVVWCLASDGTPTMSSNPITCTPDDNGFFEATITGLTAGTSYTIVSWLKLTPESEAMLSDPRTYTTESGSNPDDENWVDLGLPSGLLWATCNVGATTPEGYGNYYAWGETQTKGTYIISNYAYCTYDELNRPTSLTKYNSSSDWGTVDNLTTLLPSDDAATVYIGNGARTPTKVEWEELMNNTTSEWTSVNGVNGRRLTASNGNSIFLPATGEHIDYELNVGSIGCYWSASLYTDWPTRAWNYFLNSSRQEMENSVVRWNGLSVRAVRAPQN